MALTLDSDAALVRETALEFFRERAPVTALRKLRDEKDPTGFSTALWREMAALGWAGFLASEEYGGTDFGCVGLGQVLEAAGRSLAATPLVSTALIGASALSLAGSAAQKRAYLPALVGGERLVALALEEGAHHAPFRIATAARKSGKGWRLDGEKRFVLDGHVADLLIVAARTAGSRDEPQGITLFLVPATPVAWCAPARLWSTVATLPSSASTAPTSARARSSARSMPAPGSWSACSTGRVRGSPRRCWEAHPRPLSALCCISRTASSSAYPSARSRH